MAMTDGASDIVVLDKLGRHEPLLPGRRVVPQHLHPQASPPIANGHKVSREKSHYAFDEQVLIRANTNVSSTTNGLTQDALNELVPTSKLVSRKLFHDAIVRKSSAVGSSIEQIDENIIARRGHNSNALAPIKPSVSTNRGNVIVSQQQKSKARSLPNSTLDHANQNGFHLPHDPLAGATGDARTSKTLSRTSHIEQIRKPQQHYPVRYNASKSQLFFFFFLCSLGSSKEFSCLYKICIYMFVFISSLINFAIF